MAKMLVRKTAFPRKKTGDFVTKSRQAALLLKNVSKATRLQAILTLEDGDSHVGGLCEAMKLRRGVVSHHLATLRMSGVVTTRREGQNIVYSLTEVGRKLAGIARRVEA